MTYTTAVPTPTASVTSTPAVEVTDLRVTYGDHAAVDGVSFDVARGQVLALLGPNGAGKTTTVSVLATLRRPDGGHARVAGHDVVADARAVRAAISVTGQDTAVDDKLTGRENLRLMGRLRRLSRSDARRAADDALERFDLADAADRRVGAYSGGMRRRLDLAVSLLRAPEVLFLDEPTTGLDPRSRQQVWDVVRDVAAGGTTVLLTTQYLDEADRLADEVAVIDRGRLVARGSAADLKRRVGQAYLEVTGADGAIVRVPTDGTVADAQRLLGNLGDAVGDPARARWRLHEPTLDDVFLTLTGHGTPRPADAEEAA